ncbi:MAG: hypothetical protein ACRD3B_10435 [Candidatus Sulfotelmatobacter sp.]
MKFGDGINEHNVGISVGLGISLHIAVFTRHFGSEDPSLRPKNRRRRDAGFHADAINPDAMGP